MPYLLIFNKQAQSILLRSFSNPILKYKPSTILLCFLFVLLFLIIFFLLFLFPFSSFSACYIPYFSFTGTQPDKYWFTFFAILFKYMSLKSEVWSLIKNIHTWLQLNLTFRVWNSSLPISGSKLGCVLLQPSAIVKVWTQYGDGKCSLGGPRHWSRTRRSSLLDQDSQSQKQSHCVSWAKGLVSHFWGMSTVQASAKARMVVASFDWVGFSKNSNLHMYPMYLPDELSTRSPHLQVARAQLFHPKSCSTVKLRLVFGTLPVKKKEQKKRSFVCPLSIVACLLLKLGLAATWPWQKSEL